jgi:patatin-like phospholipase/acyl hydrolase
MTFDGGGIRGLFTAVVLDRIMKERPALVQKANLLAGTSTGGIIALCLAAGLPPSELVTLYGDKGPDIFDDSWFDDIIDIGNAIGSEYDNHRLKKHLTRSLGTLKLGDLNTRVLIPTFDLDADATVENTRIRMWKPKFFHNFPGDDSDRSEMATDVALRTSAAPTYFPSHQGYIDGGVVANNPSVAAIAQALDSDTGGQVLTDIHLISFGTGVNSVYIKGDKLDWGWGQWARPLVSLMIDGVAGVADFQCRKLLKTRYHRVDSIFTQPAKIDDTRAKSLQYLRDEGKDLDISDTLAWIDKNW